jgi:hypothetical protein
MENIQELESIRQQIIERLRNVEGNHVRSAFTKGDETLTIIFQWVVFGRVAGWRMRLHRDIHTPGGYIYDSLSDASLSATFGLSPNFEFFEKVLIDQKLLRAPNDPIQIPSDLEPFLDRAKALKE